jgi:hypothetical protein
MLRQINGGGAQRDETTGTDQHGAYDGAAPSSAPNWAVHGSSSFCGEPVGAAARIGVVDRFVKA